MTGLYTPPFFLAQASKDGWEFQWGVMGGGMLAMSQPHIPAQSNFTVGRVTAQQHHQPIQPYRYEGGGAITAGRHGATTASASSQHFPANPARPQSGSSNEGYGNPGSATDPRASGPTRP